MLHTALLAHFQLIKSNLMFEFSVIFVLSKIKVCIDLSLAGGPGLFLPTCVQFTAVKTQPRVTQ